MIRTVIVDDELLAREGIRARLELERDIEVVGEAADGEEAIEVICTLRPDLVFVDVQMPGLSGFDVLDRVAGEHLPIVIFVTAYDQYALKAFEVHALDYLLKPINSKRLAEAVSRARHEMSRTDAMVTHGRILKLLDANRRVSGPKTGQRGVSAGPGDLTRMTVKDGDRWVLVEIGEVDWFEAARNYVRIHVGQKVFLTRSTLRALEEQLDRERFIRIHRSTIVNAARIREITPEWHGDFNVTLQDGTVLRMSRTYRRNLLP